MGTYTVLPDGTKCYSGPNCLRHGNKNRLPADFATKTRAEQLKDLEKLKNPLANHTPQQVDEIIADLYDEYYKELTPLKPLLSDQKTFKKWLEAGRRHVKQEDLDGINEKINAVKTKANSVLAEIAPYEAEYSRRPWTRGFLVNNANGHVHKTMSCSTCTQTTRYLWLTEYSGKTEEELVEDAGEKACTVCYPTAPTETLTRTPKLKNRTLREAEERKQKIQAEREAKKQAALLKQITTRTGDPVLDDLGYPMKTVTTVENFVSNIHSDLRAVKEGKTSNHNPEWLKEREEAYMKALDALAFKKNLTVEEILVELKPKFDRKYKKDWS